MNILWDQCIQLYVEGNAPLTNTFTHALILVHIAIASFHDIYHSTFIHIIIYTQFPLCILIEECTLLMCVYPISHVQKTTPGHTLVVDLCRLLTSLLPSSTTTTATRKGMLCLKYVMERMAHKCSTSSLWYPQKEPISYKVSFFHLAQICQVRHLSLTNWMQG